MTVLGILPGFILSIMKLISESGVFYLDENGQRVALTPRELNLFRQMNPMGRRLILRKRALDLTQSNPGNPDIERLWSLVRLPAREWSFIVPDEKPSLGPTLQD
ncbi:MAG: hypothetical protein JWP91_3082 [Fibrobacteres bacterium]|nr:hypothetical protein [Fibrobacterota bacterium]